MPKRKRDSELTLPDKLEKHEQDIARALKTAKGFERQRLSKRSRDDGLTPDKQQRLEREISVLKSLDLHQTARAHLSSSLLKVKSIAASTDLPEEIRAGVPKPELDGDEKAALHNVTSGLYNRKPVKEAVDRAIETVCEALKLPPPGKSKPKKKTRKEQEEQPADRIAKGEETAVGTQQDLEGEEEEVTDFEGFQSDVDEPGPVVGQPDGEVSASEDEDEDEDDESEEEQQLSQYDHLLGSSSDDEEDFNDKKYDQFRGKETVNLDDISVSGSGSESDDEQSSPKPSPSLSPSPPPAPPKVKRQKKESKPGEVYALPSLMGGYVSGSESASDVDVAAPKKRRGQRARQAIWEKKYGSGAKHIQQSKRQKGGRDSGWDMKRGAVDGDDRSKRTPWKKGVANPFLQQRAQDTQRDGNTQARVETKTPKPAKRDDEGVLHASWEARKKAKDLQKGAAFSGQKIVFD